MSESPPMDIATLSPAEATAKLAEMTAAASPPPPLAPTTATDARRRLDALSGDKAWGKLFLSGDMTARREFADLSAMVAAGDDVADAIDGKAPPPQFETTFGGEQPRRVVNEVIADMREAGLSDAAIGEAIRGDPISKQEVEQVRQMQRMRLGDPDWCKRLLAGDYAARREHILMSIVLTAPIKQEAA